MMSLVTCPACARQHTLHRRFDAWACYELTGIDAAGELTVSNEFFTQTFDDNHIECMDCGEQFKDQEIVRHLQDAGPRPEDKKITYIPAGGLPIRCGNEPPD